MSGQKRNSSRRQIEILALPALLAVFVLVGGASAPGMITHSVLQLFSVLTMLFVIWHPNLFALPSQGRVFLMLTIAWVALAFVQLLPLPGNLRVTLPGGEDIAAGFSVIGETVPYMPLSLEPEQTLSGILMFLPVLAIFIVVQKLSWRALTEKMIWALPLFGLISVALGVTQIMDGGDSLFYPYEISNRGFPVGIFANTNHQSIFLLMTLPFLGALGSIYRSKWMSGDRDSGVPFLIGAMAVLISTGVILAGSLTGYALILPVLFLSLSLFLGRKRFANVPWRLAVPIVTVIGLLITVFAIDPLLSILGVDAGPGNETSRFGIWSVSLNILREYWLTGAGLGAFPSVYNLNETPGTVTNVFVNHAHNDYLEVFIEFGIIGIVLIALGLILLGKETWRVWKLEGGQEVRIKQAASIALWLPILHSVWDYPLRTPTVAVFAVLCLAIMIAPADRRVRDRKKEKTEADAKPKRMSKQIEI